MTKVRTRDELLAEGIPAATIDSRARRGQYVRVLPRTYILGEPSTFALCVAVTRWHPSTVTSHRTAAWLHGMLDEPRLVEATVPKRVRLCTPPWLKLYRRDLEPRVLVEACSVPAVCREQTIVDCIAVMPDDQAGKVVDESLRSAVESGALLALTERNPNRHGNTGVRQQLRHCAVDFASEPERRLARALNARNFRLPANRPVGPYIADFVDERAKLIVEVDGREFHSEPATFRNDRRRQNWLVREGWMVLRYAAFDVLNNPAAVADEVIDTARRRRRTRPTTTSSLKETR